MSHEEILRDYRAHAHALEAVGRAVESDLREALAAARLDVHFVSSRVKSEESLRKKLARPDKTYRQLWDVTDVLGLRVATYFEDTIEDVARLVEERFAVDYRHSVDKLRARDHGSFGYRSVHYVCALPRALGDDPQVLRAEGARFEIQIRTALQHAWAEVEHDLGYKLLVDGSPGRSAAAVPAEIRRRFSRIASLLEIADQEFVSIRGEMRRYRDRAREEGQHGARGLPIDTLTLDTVARAPGVEALDRAIGERLVKPLSDEVFYPAYLASMLAHAGIGSTSQLHAAVDEHGPHVLDMVAPYFAFARSALGLEVADVPAIQRGYALFFVAHRAIVRGPELGLSKVARLTRMYAELDGGGDERRAHELASGLVSALG
jgi:ppGpp synthetase/RelA/SpoT-type nucleotidyltranferase